MHILKGQIHSMYVNSRLVTDRFSLMVKSRVVLGGVLGFDNFHYDQQPCLTGHSNLGYLTIGVERLSDSLCGGNQTTSEQKNKQFQFF